MAAAAEPPSEILQEIEALFSWNPPRLIPAPLLPGNKTSTSTCPPAFYNKHIPVDKALREVKRLPSLVQQLAENVDTALHTASETLPSLKGFITAEDRERDVENLSQIVADEKGVASYYDKTTARFCTPLASTLALHPQASSSQWRSLVVWTTSVPRSGHADSSSSMTCIENTLRSGPMKRFTSHKESILMSMQCTLQRRPIKGAGC